MRIRQALSFATLAAFLLGASQASAQGVMYVKNNKVGIGEANPTLALLEIKQDTDASGAGFKVETAGTAPNKKTYYFAQNPVTGAFLISNNFGGNAQFIVYPNNGPNNQFSFVVRDGGIGVGRANPPVNTLYVEDGKLTSAPAWTARSSKRFKDNIQPLDNALETVQQLQGVSYNLKSDGQGSIGFIAEDVGQVIPELVQYENNGVDASTLDYDKISALLVEAVKAQQKQIEELQLQLAEQQR